ncbi:hypothetical protein L1987_74947 [Smallanthus sonchifolius]|uniref:Uncharacterized protein n=1 Tax=Smallanthus sonchifolius TaxID=185202 RepID=A0ACB9A469_9ASTR|nr:hypothetical protein L1987_74947 [Smallanthus sonchifolius]
MTREPPVVSNKTVAKDKRASPTMKHVDSPRPYPHQKPIQYERIERHLRELKETTRFSCDGRESRYQLKSNMKIKELPRLSLDSRQGYISNSANDPSSNKRPSSSVVARLMGLEGLTLSIDESKTLKTNSCLKSSRKEEVLKHVCTSVSPVVHKPKRAVKVNHVAPWKQEGGGWGLQKPPFKSKECPPRAEPSSRSIYDEIEKRLTKHKFKTAGKDLRALKQILEAMQKTKKNLESKEHALDNSHKLAMLGRHKGMILNADKLVKELCLGIDGLQNKSEIGVVSDDDDEVIYIINADVNKRSQDWDEYCNQVPGLVLDIERLIFKDLICEVVNG